MNYKLIALDMDGTLLRDDKTVSETVKSALAKASLAGKYVVISSGRSVDELKDYADAIAEASYYVLENGSLVYDARAKKTIHIDAFTEEQIHLIFDTAKGEDVILYYSGGNQTVISAEHFENLSKYGMGQYKEMFLQYHKIVPELPEYYETHREQIGKLIYFCGSPALRDQLNERLADTPVSRAYSETASLEMSPPGVTKGTGIGHLCDYLGISTEEVIAVGDAPNDLGMLRIAGLSVAMGNATDEVKELCDITVADNEHDGVAEVIYHYLLAD